MARRFVSLFTYGGGMRGLIPAHIMAAIEQKTGLAMADMVDIFTGPSTGSILNAALTRPHRRDPLRPQYSAKAMVRFYEREGANIFPRDRFREFRGLVHDFNNRMIKSTTLSRLFRHGHYNEHYLAQSLYALYGDARLSDSLASLVIPCYVLNGTSFDADQGLDGGQALWLRNIHDENGKIDSPLDVTLYDAVMASCAAPTYFQCHDFHAQDIETQRWQSMHAIDGSIFDNPCISYYSMIKPYIPEGVRPLMLCLGTGITNRAIHRDQWNRYGALGVVDPVNDLPLINIFFHAPESALKDVFGRELGDDLVILNKSFYSAMPDGMMPPTTMIDDASPENMRRLEHFAHIIIEENQKIFDETCHQLVLNRDAKQKGDKGDIVDHIRHSLDRIIGRRAPGKLERAD